MAKKESDKGGNTRSGDKSIKTLDDVRNSKKDSQQSVNEFVRDEANSDDPAQESNNTDGDKQLIEPTQSDKIPAPEEIPSDDRTQESDNTDEISDDNATPDSVDANCTTQDSNTNNDVNDETKCRKSQGFKPWLKLKKTLKKLFHYGQTEASNDSVTEKEPVLSVLSEEAIRKEFQGIKETQKTVIKEVQSIKKDLEAFKKQQLDELNRSLDAERRSRKTAVQDLNAEKNEHNKTRANLILKENKLEAKENDLASIARELDRYKQDSLNKSKDLEAYTRLISFQPKLKGFASKCLTFLQACLTLRDDAEKLNGLANEWTGPDSQAYQFIQLQMESLRCYALNTKDISWQELRELTAELHILYTTGIVFNTAHLGTKLKKLEGISKPENELKKIFFSTYFRQLGEASIILAEELALLNPHLLRQNKPEEYKADTFTELAQKLRDSLKVLGCEIDEKAKPLEPYNPRDIRMDATVTYPADMDNVIARVKTLSIRLGTLGDKESSAYISQKPSE